MMQLLTDNVWDALAAHAKRNKRPVWVAVPYFGKGGAKLLHLPPGSQLVVNASEGNVKAGAVHPNDLLALLKRGVRVFHFPNLHAKVYAFRNRAYVGSANVSNTSARLTEALICTTDRDMVAEAKAFIAGMCAEELAPRRLTQLQALYSPPKLGLTGLGQNGRGKVLRSRLLVAQLNMTPLTDEENAADAAGKARAQKLRRRRGQWHIDSFCWEGPMTVKKGDRIIEVVEEDNGVDYVSPPRPVLFIHKHHTTKGLRYFVYVERPIGERRSRRERIAKKLGRSGKALLAIDGFVRRPANIARLERVFIDRRGKA